MQAKSHSGRFGAENCVFVNGVRSVHSLDGGVLLRALSMGISLKPDPRFFHCSSAQTAALKKFTRDYSPMTFGDRRPSAGISG